MKRFFVAGVLKVLIAPPAFADDMEAARRLCTAIEAGGSVSPCRMSPETHTVRATISGSPVELTRLCYTMVKTMQDAGLFFEDPEWTLLLGSPDSAGAVVTYCSLPIE